MAHAGPQFVSGMHAGLAIAAAALMATAVLGLSLGARRRPARTELEPAQA